MMNLVKKQGLGTWITLGTLLLALIGLIIYGAAVSAGTGLMIASGSEDFYDVSRAADTAMRTNVVAGGVIALVFMCAAIVLGQLKLEGLVGKIVDGITGALRIIVPALLMLATLSFVYGSITGLAWTFFSNEELEIYAEATKVGGQVITGVVFFAIAAIAGIVASFFNLTKKTVE